MTSERPLAPSRIVRSTPQQPGGGRHRDALIDNAERAISDGSHNFALAARLLDTDTRDGVMLLYAWCRRCDDIIADKHHARPLDHAVNDLKDAEDRIQAIRVLTRRALAEQPTADPAFDGFGLLANEYRLTGDMANDVIAGLALDAAEWRPRTEADLMRYCYHAAGAVAVMAARIMGVPADDGETLDRACDMGIAIELANIARDVVRDNAPGHCYLPIDWLVEMDFSPGEHAKPHNRAALAQLMPRLIALMERYEAAARLGTKSLGFRQRWAVLTAANIYGAIGRRVVELGPDAWNERVTIGRIAKLGHVASAFRDALINRPEGPAEPITWTRHDYRPVAGW